MRRSFHHHPRTVEPCRRARRMRFRQIPRRAILGHGKGRSPLGIGHVSITQLCPKERPFSTSHERSFPASPCTTHGPSAHSSNSPGGPDPLLARHLPAPAPPPRAPPT